MDFTRNLKKGTSGEDVLFCKQKLLELGFYGDHITTVTRKTFGADTLEAVKRFQAQAALTVDGVIGKETWAALIDGTITETEPVKKGTVSVMSKAICALALTRIGSAVPLPPKLAMLLSQPWSHGSPDGGTGGQTA